MCNAGWIPLAEARKLHMLNTCSEKQAERCPDVPAVAELEYKVV